MWDDRCPQGPCAAAGASLGRSRRTCCLELARATASDTAAWGWSSWFAAAVQVHLEDGEDRAVERELQSPAPPPQGCRAGARARHRTSPREM
jgi:hypothetical protein